MAIYKRGKIYWYKFMWAGKLVRESTKQSNDKVARQMEAAHRTSLAKGEVGIRDRKQAPTLAEFADKRFVPWAKSSTSQKTWLDYYRPGLRAISNYKPIASLRLDQITSEHISEFAAWRQSQGLQVSSVNSTLQVIRRILHLAAEWGVIEKAPKIKLLPGERRREHIVGHEEEARYLAAAPELLASIATVLADTGMRTRRVLSALLGVNHLDKWAERLVASNPRQDGSGTSGPADDTASQGSPSGTLGTGGYAI